MTNPTERPEEHSHGGQHHSPHIGKAFAAHDGIAEHTHANDAVRFYEGPTERPKERDSLAAVVKRFDATPKTLRNGQVYKDLRTLINEVKGWEQQFADLETVDTGIIRRLEAEVKELREENARLGHAMSQTQMFKREQALNSRIKQMEEALRGIAAKKHVPPCDETVWDYCNCLYDIATRALSPSDTEEGTK
jgi:hypothetical protein